MQWTTPKYNDRSRIRRFLWLPVNFGGVTKWLEYADIERVYMHGCWFEVGWSEGAWD